MYAVFRSGGKQYRASKGETLKLEKLDAEEGANISFDEVLLVGEGSDIKVGSPLLSGTSVSAKVLKQGKSRKVSVVKFRRRQNYLRQHTHRQFFTEVEITGIGAGKKVASKAASDAPTEKKPAKKTSSVEKPAAKSAATKKPSKEKTSTEKPVAKKKETATKAAAKKPVAKKAAAKKPAKKKAAKKKTT